ncbi:hypothetical protein [Ornithinimicrobium sp. INDO-MA30-4]|uniref:hypothetical protein n=1 Tax=Ornithinimicrobium sp. INDO-MA30-4 TaxID=2908651 RepID=UPI001F263DE5|nr:hypothetical protein [Ornithinimicrobium sp. INDO-MA30-4]UJH71806.1 hypothetical protein L0A91_16520 [Ornithinimicrobium sp. INDO-MA30-4]
MTMYAELLATLDRVVTLPPTTFPFQTVLDAEPRDAAQQVRASLRLGPPSPSTT